MTDNGKTNTEDSSRYHLEDEGLAIGRFSTHHSVAMQFLEIFREDAASRNEEWEVTLFFSSARNE